MVSMSMVHNFHDKIFKRLYTAGWNPDDNPSPFETYRILKKSVIQVGADTMLQLWEEFCNIRLGNFSTLEAFLERLTTLDEQLSRESTVPDTMFIAVALRVIKDRDPIAYNQWNFSFEREKSIKKKDLLEWLQRKCNDERSTLSKSFGNIKTSSTSTKPQQTATALSKPDDSNLPYGDRVCTDCNQKTHHKNKNCWKKHPELLKAFLERKTQREAEDDTGGSSSGSRAIGRAGGSGNISSLNVGDSGTMLFCGEDESGEDHAEKE